MIADWPSELPLPSRKKYQHGRTEARLNTKMDAGVERTRLLSSNVADPVAWSITVDRNGKAIFDTFFKETTKRGSILFWIADPTTDGWAILDENNVPLLDGDDTPLLFSETWLCKFGDQMPVETVLGVEFEISFTLSVMP